MTALGQALLDLATQQETSEALATKVCTALGKSHRWDHERQARQLSKHLQITYNNKEFVSRQLAKEYPLRRVVLIRF